MKVLITGISGFAGSHLAEYLHKQNTFHIIGTYLLDKSIDSLSHLKKDIDLVQIDLQDEKSVNSLIMSKKPDFVFHLAALTSPAHSFKNPAETITNNIKIQINILEAIRNAKLLNTRILIVSSADVYGIVEEKDLPIDEQTPFMPTNPYAVSKIAQDFLGLQYYISYKLPIVRVRPFNHIGPHQQGDLVIASFARRIAQIEKGEEKILYVGNLDTKRDFTDVRDMVRAYLMILEEGKSGQVYNIGSEQSYKISDVLKILVSLAKVKINIVSDPSLFRPSDTPELICDATKIQKKVGWKPEIPIEQTLKDTLDYWRNLL